MTSFLGENPENGDLNQYWYSRKTISTIVDEIVSLKVLRVAFLSTPSIYFSMPQDMRDNSYLFDVSFSKFNMACSSVKSFVTFLVR